MSQYSWVTCPPAIKAQVHALREQLQAMLQTNLVGLYLHGSLAMDCFNPERSDIDLLVVTSQGMEVETKHRVAEVLLHISMAPRPIEISFLVEHDIHPFHHPLPFDLHYSESWRERYCEALEHGIWLRWNDETQRDNDLAAHLTITLHRGICLYGKPIKEALPTVPEQHYRAAIIGDFEEACEEREKMAVYFVLNACRVYAYMHEGAILSKDEGGVWCLGGLHVIPKEHHTHIKQALGIYRGDFPDQPFDSRALDSFAAYVDERIRLQLRNT